MSNEKVSNIDPKSLIVDLEIQQRANHLDEGTVQDYKAVVDEGWNFPPIVVFVDPKSGEQWLADGFHRIEAARALGLDKIPAEIHEGTRRDAVLHAVGANATHGLPRTNADKHKAVEAMLADPEWSQMTNRQIAERCRVSYQLVASLRNKFKATGKVPSQTSPISPTQSRHLPKSESTADSSRQRTVGSAETHYTSNVIPMRRLAVNKANKARALIDNPPPLPSEHAKQVFCFLTDVLIGLRKSMLANSKLRQISRELVSINKELLPINEELAQINGEQLQIIGELVETVERATYMAIAARWQLSKKDADVILQKILDAEDGDHE